MIFWPIARLAEQVAPVKIAAGEHVPNRVLFKNYLQMNCLGFCQVDALRVAGVSEFIVLSLLAKAFGVPVVPHVGDTGQLHQHLVLFNHVALGHKALFLEYIPHLHEQFSTPCRVEGGVYLTPQETARVAIWWTYLGWLAMGLLDILVVVFYLVAIVGLGCWAGLRAGRIGAPRNRPRSTSSRAGLKWPVIGLAIFATNISTVHLVGLAEAGYKSGLLMGNFELLAGVTLVILAMFFAPFYIRSRVATLPDFLEKRYSRSSRDIVAVLSVFSAIFIHIGFSLYTGAIVLNGIFGVELSKPVCVFAIALLTGVTVAGGLTAWSSPNRYKRSSCLPAQSSSRSSAGFGSVDGADRDERCRNAFDSAAERGRPGGLPWYALSSAIQ